LDLCLIAMNWWNTNLWLAILEVAVGLGFVIFVHEFGHFAVAKLCGVKVDKFYLGFDIYGLKLAHFRWGETDYGIGILPLGGYVKMLGQEDNPARLRQEIERAKQKDGGDESLAAGLAPRALPPDADAADVAHAEQALFDPRSYLAQSVPRRMAIISAGVIMNLVFALLLAVVAFGPGVWRPACTIGQVTPGGGAWQVGLRSGDEVIEIGGRRIRNFRDIFEAIALGDVENGVSMKVQRPGVKEPLEFLVPTQRIGGRPGVGIGPPADAVLTKDDEFFDLLPFVPGSPASNTQPAFRRGDRFLKLDDQTVEDHAQIHAYLALHRDRPVNVTVRRAAAKKNAQDAAPPEEATIRVEPSPMRHFGLSLEMGPITAIQKGSPAEQAGLQPGDVLQTLDGRPIADPMTLSNDLRRRAGQSVTLGVSGNDRQGTVPVAVTPRLSDQYSPSPPGRPVAVPELGVAYRVLNTVRAVQPGGPAAEAGLLPGDLLETATLQPPVKDVRDELRNKYGPSSELDQSEEKLTLGEDKFSWPYLMYELQLLLPGTTVNLQWSHEGQTTKATLEPMKAADWFSPDRGWHFEAKAFLQTADSFPEAVQFGTDETVDATLVVFRSLRKIRSGQVSARNLGGPWSIFKFALYEAMQGPGNLLLFLTLLGANLAVLNFLPIPLLDGGHFVLLLYEGIRGKPADERVQEILTYIGLALILGLMIFVLGLDFGLIPRPGPGQ
jgi:regulator of sigma E protease